MPGPLDEPSKNVFSPSKQYYRVRWIGDRKAHDFELNEAQQIQDAERQGGFEQVFQDSVVVSESGGTIAPARTGVSVIQNMSAISAGVYTGIDTQIYTLITSVSGPPGTAQVHVTSDGPDNGDGAGYTITTSAADPLDGTVFYDVGTFGAKVAFVHPAPNVLLRIFAAPDSWLIAVTAKQRLPETFNSVGLLVPSPIYVYARGRVRRAALDSLGVPRYIGSSQITFPGDVSSLLAIDENLRLTLGVNDDNGVGINSRVATVSAVSYASGVTTVTVTTQGYTLDDPITPNATATIGSTLSVVSKGLQFSITTSGFSQVFIEMIRTIVTASDDPDLLDPFTLRPAAEREKIVASFKTYDPAIAGDPLPDGALERIVFPVYHWNRDLDTVTRVKEKPVRFPLSQIPGAIQGNQLVDVDFSEELKGTLATRTYDSMGSFLVEGYEVQNSTTPNTASDASITRLISIGPGKAYVNGLRNVSSLFIDLKIPKPTTTSDVNGEPKLFTTGVSSYSLNKAIGNNALPISAVTSALGQIHAKEQISHSSPSDLLNNQPVTQLTAVYVWSGGVQVNYTIDSDVTLSGNSALWLANEPSGGTSIIYEYDYTRTMTQGSNPASNDYDVVDTFQDDDDSKDSILLHTFVSPPGTPPTLVAGSSGSMAAGVYRYKVTFVYSSPGGTRETNPGGTSAPVTVGASGKVTLSDIPTGPSGIVSSRKLWRTTANANHTIEASYKLVTTLSDNVTTDYVDTTADGSLGATLPNHNNATAPVTPNDNSLMVVSYDFNLPRKDMIFLRQDGTVGFTLGIPAEVPVTPKAAVDVLPLAEVHFKNADTSLNVEPEISNYLLKRFTVNEQQTIVRKLDDFQYNLARDNLVNQTLTRASSGFKGIVSDPFTSTEFADTTFSRPAGDGGYDDPATVTYDATIDIEHGELQLPRFFYDRPLTFNLSKNPATHTQARLNTNFVTLPFNEVVEISQDLWTEETNINPFDTFNPPTPQIRIFPERDFWIDITESSQTIISNVVIWGHHPPTETITTFRRVTDRAAVYMRQIKVRARGENFVPGEDRIRLTFANQLVNLTPILGTSAGTPFGSISTVKASISTGDPTFDGNFKLNGDWDAEFFVPRLIRTGQASVTATGDQSSASAVFTSNGILRNIVNIINIVRATYQDPVAQTFAFSAPTDITSLKFPLASKDPSVPLSLNVSPVVMPGGFPDLPVFAAKRFDPGDLTTGQTSANSFAFDDPLFFAPQVFGSVIYRTGSTKYRVYTATLGHATVVNPQWVTKNPNIRGTEPPGIFLESLNALNWEPRSLTALRYTLYRAQYTTDTAYAYCDDVSLGNEPWTHMVLLTDESNPDGTEVSWEYSIDGLPILDGATTDPNPNKVWLPIVPFVNTAFPSLVTNINVRAKLTSLVWLDSSGKPRISPRININNAALIGQRIKQDGYYIVESAEFLTLPSDTAKAGQLYAEVFVPAGTKITFFASNAEEDGTSNPIWEIVDPNVNPTADPHDADELGATILDVGDGLPAGGGFVTRALGIVFDNTIAEKTVKKNKIRVRVDMTQLRDPSNASLSVAPTLTPFIKNLAFVVNPVVYNPANLPP